MTTLVTTNRSAYPVSAVPLNHRAWKYMEGAKVKHCSNPDGEHWVVLKRLSIAPFPHYEMMDDHGYRWIVPQLKLMKG
jgi:hypothetical protein